MGKTRADASACSGQVRSLANHAEGIAAILECLEARTVKPVVATNPRPIATQREVVELPGRAL